MVQITKKHLRQQNKSIDDKAKVSIFRKPTYSVRKMLYMILFFNIASIGYNVIIASKCFLVKLAYTGVDTDIASWILEQTKHNGLLKNASIVYSVLVHFMKFEILSYVNVHNVVSHPVEEERQTTGSKDTWAQNEWKQGFYICDRVTVPWDKVWS